MTFRPFGVDIHTRRLASELAVVSCVQTQTIVLSDRYNTGHVRATVYAPGELPREYEKLNEPLWILAVFVNGDHCWLDMDKGVSSDWQYVMVGFACPDCYRSGDHSYDGGRCPTCLRAAHEIETMDLTRCANCSVAGTFEPSSPLCDKCDDSLQDACLDELDLNIVISGIRTALSEGQDPGPQLRYVLAWLLSFKSEDDFLAPKGQPT